MCGFFFVIFHHPLIMVLILIVQTIRFFMVNFFFKPSIWFSYILFLILVGGLLIIFIYLSALIPNEIFFSSPQFLYLALIFLSPIFYSKKTTQSYSPLDSPLNFRALMLEKNILWLLIYLLVTLVVSILLLNNLKTPLKQKIYAPTTKNSPPS